MKKVQTNLILILLVLLSGSVGMAQEAPYAERKEIAKEAIRVFKDGQLIVRLKSKTNKLEALNQLLEKNNLEAEQQAKIKKEIKATIEERDRFNASLVKAFEEDFNFAEVYYMYDTASTSLRSGVKQGIFLDSSLQPNAEIQLPEGPFFVAKVGTTDGSSTTGIEALILMDQTLTDLQRPFPYYVRVNSIQRVFMRIFSPRKLVRRDSKEIVLKLEEKLRKFWEKQAKNQFSSVESGG